MVEYACKLTHPLGLNPDLFFTKYSLGIFANDFSLNNAKAKRVLNYQPKLNTQQTLASYAQWYKKTKPLEQKPDVRNSWSWSTKALLGTAVAVTAAAVGYSLFSSRAISGTTAGAQSSMMLSKPKL